MTTDKAELRRQLRKQLQGIAEADYQALSQAVQQNLFTAISELLSVQDFSDVLVYQPIAKWREVDLSTLNEQFPNLKFTTASNTQSTPLPEGKFDLTILPLLGFNKDGFRLGHGAGWYDQLLATQTTAITIGVGYEMQQVDFSAENHDIRLNLIVTDKTSHIFC